MISSMVFIVISNLCSNALSPGKCFKNFSNCFIEKQEQKGNYKNPHLTVKILQECLK